MAEAARGSNGKFAKKSGDVSPEPSLVNPGNSEAEPNGNAGQPEIVIDPAEIDAGRDAGAGSEPKRGRGRPAGAKAKAESRPEASGKLDLDSLNFTLFYAHSLLAKATNTPELELTQDESKTMATCAMNVMQHYNIKASQKAIDWGNFLLTAGILYGGKIHAINVRVAKEKQDKKDETNRNIAPFGVQVNG